ncbi:MAG: hypothetical protein HY320_16215 [Armatimonadetes bacterium]|nr:hypothetical protein [Armatimonadota bacterium]
MSDREPEQPEPAPFQPPEGQVVAGIVEQNGYVPVWIVAAIAVAIFLALICWIPIYGY